MLSLLVGTLDDFERAIVGPTAFSSVATLNLVGFGRARSCKMGTSVNIAQDGLKGQFLLNSPVRKLIDAPFMFMDLSCALLVYSC